MPDKSAEQVAHGFVDAINRQSVDAVAELMTEDHVFIDSLGARVEGRERMKAGWAGYFKMVPGYAIAIEETYSAGSVVVMLGAARGTYAGESWQTPSAWRAVIRDSQVAEWRVYADNEPIRALMRKPTH
jgi:ketosteroid isomerase-like protein